MIPKICIATYKTIPELDNQSNSHVINFTDFVGKKFEKNTEKTLLYNVWSKKQAVYYHPAYLAYMQSTP